MKHLLKRIIKFSDIEILLIALTIYEIGFAVFAYIMSKLPYLVFLVTQM